MWNRPQYHMFRQHTCHRRIFCSSCVRRWHLPKGTVYAVSLRMRVTGSHLTVHLAIEAYLDILCGECGKYAAVYRCVFFFRHSHVSTPCRHIHIRHTPRHVCQCWPGKTPGRTQYCCKPVTMAASTTCVCGVRVRIPPTTTTSYLLVHSHM